MQRLHTVNAEAGTTLRLTYVNSGVTPTNLCSTLYDSSETLVSSVPAVSSGSGFYYALHLMPTSRQWMVNKWFALIATNTYVSQQMVHVKTLEVD